jgi:hypothetical protein
MTGKKPEPALVELGARVHSSVQQSALEDFTSRGPVQ